MQKYYRTVGAVYDRAHVVDTTKNARSQSAPTVTHKTCSVEFCNTLNLGGECARLIVISSTSRDLNFTIYVHCQGGRHRTGVMTAFYRMPQDGWTADRAYQEMKQYRFEGFPGHPELKSFVYDYYSKLDGSRAVARTP